MLYDEGIPTYHTSLELFEVTREMCKAAKDKEYNYDTCQYTPSIVIENVSIWLINGELQDTIQHPFMMATNKSYISVYYYSSTIHKQQRPFIFQYDVSSGYSRSHTDIYKYRPYLYETNMREYFVSKDDFIARHFGCDPPEIKCMFKFAD